RADSQAWDPDRVGRLLGLLRRPGRAPLGGRTQPLVGAPPRRPDHRLLTAGVACLRYDVELTFRGDLMQARQFLLASRPTGAPTPENFALRTVELPPLESGQVLVRNEMLSVDPYMRPRMDDRPSYVPPYELGEPLTGGAVGVIIASESPDRPVGARVRHSYGWRDLAIASARETELIPDTEFPLSYHLGVLGMPGLTAFAGLTEVGGIRE